ncbi:protein OrgA [Pseudomonas gingeri]|uniref:Protein OrgA n=1 Tax=Pseudomonas gingeri TaxID=117681 RepID=A0A7Y7Y8B9_9PSED|nr:protein OrgA [Pseudomonas gingeri]NVZ99872.1 protein OrgA [Pseudomonas gingeri]NWA16712.1 protein OrgA [Pseudomonas gingeri]NWA53902.1 protein OrgA [Pseudomonas gingeri]NWA94134.1 protein OrgA [Pseudomonas gingeri]NWB01966.1 protein OrgA [Pseudomonas gingeri]
MSFPEEQLQQILWQPLDYLHARRLTLPEDVGGAAVRQVLNRMLLEGLGLQTSCSTSSALAALWVREWRRLPHIARLIGAQRLWPALARGARMGLLSAGVRDFARCAIGPRLVVEWQHGSPVLQQVDSVGLAQLLAFERALPAALCERLPLQFPEAVVAGLVRWPACVPDPALFFLAVQHARRHPQD